MTRSRIGGVAVLALLVTGLGVPAPEAAAAVGPASVTLEGRGYGHGRGLSQWGAQGAAVRDGKTYRQILRFYFPGLSLGKVRGSIRVLITADTSDDVVVRNRKDLIVRRVADGTTWDLGRLGGKKWKLTATNQGADSRLWKFTDGWRPVRTIPGEAEFLGDHTQVTLITPGGSVRMVGAVRSAISPTGGRDTVNSLLVEEYLRGVVPLEVPALWHPEAVRAQAVAARTYAAYHLRHPVARHYDICDTTQCQVYAGIAAAHPASDRAIRATRRQILVAGGRPAFTQFSASNGGWSVRGSFPYLQAKRDPWDRWSGNPYRRWTATISASAFERAYPAIGDFQRLRVRRRDGHGAWHGRVLRVRVVGSAGSVNVSGDALRSALALRSSWWRQV